MHLREKVAGMRTLIGCRAEDGTERRLADSIGRCLERGPTPTQVVRMSYSGRGVRRPVAD